MKKEIHVHQMVANLARELTLASYEALMKNDLVWTEWKRRHPGASPLGLQAAFAKKYLSAHIAPARTTLAGMLSQPYDEELKSKIHDALVQDNTLTRGRDQYVH